jgi:RNA polymerase sigma factor (sigma-70 family)
MAANNTANTVYGRQAYAIGYFQASRVGLQHDDAQDCAMDFVIKALGREFAEIALTSKTAWLHRCAYNHALNYSRTISRRRQREQSWTERYGEDAEREANARPAAVPGPRTLTLRKELWHQVAAAVQRLTPMQQELFVRHHFRHQTARELAAMFDRTPHAMEESLSNIRRRLAALLRSSGWTDEETQALFKMSPLPEPPPKR